MDNTLIHPTSIDQVFATNVILVVSRNIKLNKTHSMEREIIEQKRDT